MLQFSRRLGCHRNILVMSTVKMAIDTKHTKMWCLNRRSFVHSFRPIYYWSRVFGLMPFSIIYDPNGDVEKPRVRAIDGLLFAVFIVVRLWFSVNSLRKIHISSSSDVPWVLSVGGYTLLTLNLTCGALMTVMNMYNRHKIVNILKMFSTIDKQVKNLIFSEKNNFIANSNKTFCYQNSLSSTTFVSIIEVNSDEFCSIAQYLWLRLLFQQL